MYEEDDPRAASATELVSIIETSDTTPLKKTDDASLGKPVAKALVDTKDTIALLISFLSLAMSICAITPHLKLSWQLGYENQLVVIGFLLSVMNLSMMRIAPTLFLVLETRWGTSRLQNYEALLRNTVLLSQTALMWRAVLSILILLPLGLSASYKKFSNGFSSANVHPAYARHYGLASPPMGDYNVMNNSVYLAINASVPFLAATPDHVPLKLSELPKAFGFNTLLIDNTTAALLDVPEPNYISSIQRSLSTQEVWTLSASVHATVARYNEDFPGTSNNDTYWDRLMSGVGLASHQLFQSHSMNLGLTYNYINASENISPQCSIGYYSSSHVNGLSRFAIGSNDTTRYRESSPLTFTIQREACSGTWQVTKSHVHLTKGVCNHESISQKSLISLKNMPFYLDALPVLVHSIQDFSPVGSRNASHWRVPSITVSAATMYWARQIWMNHYLSNTYVNDSDIYYPAKNEIVTSTRVTMNAQWLLYVVLCVQPILTLCMFVFGVSFYDTPISKGFGIAAILSGVDKSSLDIMKGAALSGKLERPVTLGVSTLEPVRTGKNSDSGSILYTLGYRGTQKSSVRRGVKYQ